MSRQASATTVISLCVEIFTVPLRKKGIRYLLIGNPILCDAYTQEQYKDAGIEFVEVLSTSAPERHEPGSNSLADFLHTAMETERVQKKLEIAINGSENRTYQSRGAAEHMAEEIFTSTYEQAAAYFDPNHDDCIAGTAAVEYANTLQEKMSAVMNILRSYDEACPAVWQIDDLISGAESELKNLLLKNLAENADFYRLYQSSCFQSRLKVEEVSAYADPLMDIADAIEKKVNGFFDGIIGALEQLQDWLDDADDKEGHNWSKPVESLRCVPGWSKFWKMVRL